MSELTDILDEGLTSEEVILVSASMGKRLANYIIDMIIFYIILGLLGTVMFVVYDTLSADSRDITEPNALLDYLITYIAIVVYYCALEHFLSGKTIGKYITKTRVVNLDGSTPDLGTFLRRSLSRIVPFDGLSFLGELDRGWHDRWTDTRVIDEKLSQF